MSRPRAARRRGPGGGAPAAPRPERPRLAVTVDGAPLAEAEARELWTAFSRHMDENQGDTAGFARLRGYASVSPEYVKGQAVLVIVLGCQTVIE